jgi:AraC family transcriptional regulator of adaptative response / methylphosphotriester-DNA alkyltransferase methyltransferase
MTGSTQELIRDTQGQRERTVRERALLVQQATTYVDGRVAEALSLDECARALYVSPRQLQRALADHGTTWRRLVLEARMRLAAQHLADRHWTVRRVARSVGYTEPGQFAKAFRRSHGVTPSEYRQGARGVREIADAPEWPAARA